MRSSIERSSVFSFLPIYSPFVAFALALLIVARLAGQNTAASLTLISKEGRRAIPLTVASGQELVGLDDLAAVFQLTVREESGAITVSYKGRTIVLTPDQSLASVAGRLISLPSPPARVGGRWAVPIEFISRALGPIYDSRLDLRRPANLLIVGDLRVPHVSIRHEPLATATRLTIDAAPRTTSTVSQDSGHLTIRFDADAIEAAVPSFQPEGFIQAIRVADPSTIVVDLGPRFAAYRASTEPIEDTTRLVLDFAGADANTSAAPPAAPAPPPPPTDLALFGQPASAIRTIALDAGHGGDDGGAKGANGTVEKDLTLAVARRLKSAIEGRLGIRVLLTRDEDRNVPLDERTAIANNSKADLFISLHANASLRPAPSGASVYVAAFSETAESRTSLTPERVPTFGGGARDIELVEWDLAQIRYIDQSTEMAHVLAQQFDGRVPLDHQPLAAGPFRVLESANMPAVLIEMGYLTNADQEKQLAGADFQNTFVQATMDAIVKFREYLEKAAGGER